MKTSIRKRNLFMVAALLLLGGSLAGCSGSNSNSNSSASPSPTPSATESASAPAETAEANTEEAAAPEESAVSEQPANDADFDKIKYAEHAKASIPEIADGLELEQKTYDFLVTNNKLFPALTAEDISAAKALTDKTISNKLLNKNVGPYLDKMAAFEGTVISVEETNLDDGTTLAILHVMDDNDQSYQVLIYKSTGDILEEDYVQFWGVPVGTTSFENVSGGFTNALFFIGAHVEKIQAQ